MRAYRFSPIFDRLDARIVLTDPGVLGSLIPVAGTVLASTGTGSSGSMPGAGTTIVPPTGWYQGGSGCPSTGVSTGPMVTVPFQTATSLAAN